jgi:hypothetical protein
MTSSSSRQRRARLRVSRRTVLATVGLLLALLAFAPFVRPAAGASGVITPHAGHLSRV